MLPRHSSGLSANASEPGPRIHAVPTSEETATLARQEGIPLLTLAEAGILDLTVDGADEVDLRCDIAMHVLPDIFQRT